MDEFFIDEVQVSQLRYPVVHYSVGIVILQPPLAVLCFAFIEAQVDRLVVIVSFIVEGYLVAFEVAEVLLSFLVG